MHIFRGKCIRNQTAVNHVQSLPLTVSKEKTHGMLFAEKIKLVAHFFAHRSFAKGVEKETGWKPVTGIHQEESQLLGRSGEEYGK